MNPKWHEFDDWNIIPKCDCLRTQGLMFMLMGNQIQCSGKCRPVKTNRIHLCMKQTLKHHDRRLVIGCSNEKEGTAWPFLYPSHHFSPHLNKWHESKLNCSTWWQLKHVRSSAILCWRHHSEPEANWGTDGDSGGLPSLFGTSLSKSSHQTCFTFSPSKVIPPSFPSFREELQSLSQECFQEISSGLAQIFTWTQWWTD